MEEHPSPELKALYNSLLSSSALIEKEADAYLLYARSYANRRTSEALDYLLKESYRRGYDEDALMYIADKRSASGDTPGLRMMEYEVYRRMGHQQEAARALRAAEEVYPDSYDINVEGCRLRLADAAEAMSEGAYARAVEPLEYVREHSLEEEFKVAAVRRLAVCYTELSDFVNAKEMLTERLRTESPAVVTVDYARLLVKQGRADEALGELHAAWKDTQVPSERNALRYSYEELAIPLMKNSMQEGSYPYVLSLCDTMLEMDPSNYWALRYACRASEDPEKYVDAGMAAYPDDVSFRIRKAGLLVSADRPDEALDLLRGIMDEHPGDEALGGAYVAAASRKAQARMAQKDYDGAASVLDSALSVRPSDKELRYTRGLVYEKRKQWDSAYVYQRFYVPSVLEEREFLEKMKALRNRCYRNSVDVGYDFFRFATSHNITGIATVGYNHVLPDGSSFGGRVNYSARDGYQEGNRLLDSGGRGFQIQGSYARKFSQSWEMTADAAYGTRYFPIVSVNAAAKYTLPSDWELEAGALFRVMQDTTTIAGVTLASAVPLDRFYLSGKVTAGVFHNRFFANGSVRGRFYPFDGGRTHIEALAGLGSAPELDFVNIYFDSYLFNHLNTFVSLGANWLLTDNLSMNLSGSWHTLYDQQALGVSYRNLLVGHVQFTIYF
jgi:tetratricopeptide (TPR) repeat protein